MTKLTRQKVELPPILLRSETQRALAYARLKQLPLDPDQPVEILMREQVKKRKLSLNAAMWAGPLKDIETQARYPPPNGDQYPALVWHGMLKEKFLPDPDAEGFDPTWALEDYRKWIYDPFKDERTMVGSTTKLTNKGMRRYLLEIEAYMSQEFGVTFTTHTEPERPPRKGDR